MKTGEVVFSISDYAKEFIKQYKNPKLDQKVIDAIVVDFVNFFAFERCTMDLAMYTADLRDGKKMSEEGVSLQKDIIYTHLMYCRHEYEKYGIIRSVNESRHMNECEGKASGNNKEAVKVVEDFIKGYMEVK